MPGIATVLVKFLQLFLFHLFKKNATLNIGDMERMQRGKKILRRKNLKDLANFDEYPTKLGFTVQVPAL